VPLSGDRDSDYPTETEVRNHRYITAARQSADAAAVRQGIREGRRAARSGEGQAALDTLFADTDLPGR
jgi:hypothetical protein